MRSLLTPTLLVTHPVSSICFYLRICYFCFRFMFNWLFSFSGVLFGVPRPVAMRDADAALNQGLAEDPIDNCQVPRSERTLWSHQGLLQVTGARDAGWRLRCGHEGPSPRRCHGGEGHGRTTWPVKSSAHISTIYGSKNKRRAA